MDLSSSQIRELAQLIELDVPEVDLESIALRLSALLTEMAKIERELGAEMNKTEPIPPVYPHDPGD